MTNAEIAKQKEEIEATKKKLQGIVDEELKKATGHGIRIPALEDGSEARPWAKVVRFEKQTDEELKETIRQVVGIWNYGIESMNGCREVRWELFGHVVEVPRGKGKIWDVCLCGRFKDSDKQLG